MPVAPSATQGWPPRRTRSALAIFRFLNGFSQRELAERAGVAKRTIANVEAGVHTPRITTATAIAGALGMDDPRLVFPEAFRCPLNDESRAANSALAKERGVDAHDRA